MREDEAKQIVQEIVDGWSKVYIKLVQFFSTNANIFT